MAAALLYVRWRSEGARHGGCGLTCDAGALAALAVVRGPDGGGVRDGVRSNWLLMALLPFATRSRAAFVAPTAFALPASLFVGWLSWVAVGRPARRPVRHAAG